jgi:hypothetical protein
MVNSPFVYPSLVSREAELGQICQLLERDRDFAVVGVPGIGRRTLIRTAAQQVGARMLEIDCLRCRTGGQLLRLLADGLIDSFASPAELGLIQQWSLEQPLTLDRSLASPARLLWPEPVSEPAVDEWRLFQTLLGLPQYLAEQLNSQVFIAFYNLPHIRAWDRQGKWENYLRQEIQRHSRVSYALVATMAEPWVYASDLPVVHLYPLADAELEPWAILAMAAKGLKFDPVSQALQLFLRYVRGHFGSGIALAQRVWLDYQAFDAPSRLGFIQAYHVQRSMLALVQDMAPVFEALLLLLPPSQARVLEILALDPTDSPQSQTYIKKHQLSRGGGLQGALTSLEQKGLLYGPAQGYQTALPLLDFWLKQRLI